MLLPIWASLVDVRGRVLNAKQTNKQTNSNNQFSRREIIKKNNGKGYKVFLCIIAVNWPTLSPKVIWQKPMTKWHFRWAMHLSKTKFKIIHPRNTENKSIDPVSVNIFMSAFQLDEHLRKQVNMSWYICESVEASLFNKACKFTEGSLCLTKFSFHRKQIWDNILYLKIDSGSWVDCVLLLQIIHIREQS